MSELDPLLTELQSLIEKASPSERRKLATQIAKQLRATQAARIKANQTPEGAAYAERKPQPTFGRKRKGRIKKAMFGKLIRTRWLKAKGSASEATVEFIGAASRIASVHQFGLRDRVNDYGTMVKYPQRELLGFSEKEQEMIEDLILSHLSGA
ncbi:MAG: phage virion morphogenesis protein [Tolumonas sp.]